MMEVELDGDFEYYYSIPYYSIYDITDIHNSYNKSKSNIWRYNHAVFFY